MRGYLPTEGPRQTRVVGRSKHTPAGHSRALPAMTRFRWLPSAALRQDRSPRDPAQDSSRVPLLFRAPGHISTHSFHRSPTAFSSAVSPVKSFFHLRVQRIVNTVHMALSQDLSRCYRTFVDYPLFQTDPAWQRWRTRKLFDPSLDDSRERSIRSVARTFQQQLFYLPTGQSRAEVENGVYKDASSGARYTQLLESSNSQPRSL